MPSYQGYIWLLDMSHLGDFLIYFTVVYFAVVFHCVGGLRVLRKAGNQTFREADAPWGVGSIVMWGR